MDEQTKIEEKAKKPGRPAAASKENVDELQERVRFLEVRLDSLTNAIRHSAHTMGWPPDLLLRNGIVPFDKTKEKLNVNGR